MAVYLTEIAVDLALPPAQRPIPHQFAMGDNNAYTFTALLCDSRTPDMGLLTGTVSGELVRPDGETVALEGTKGSEVRVVNLDQGGQCNATPCSVTLPQACFSHPGRVTLTIKLTDGTTITQALSVSAVVVRTSTDVVVDPGEVVPDVAELQAIATEMTAAVAGAVRFDAAQSLTDAQKAQARSNITAASLIPTGTAFAQAVQDGTTYDVQDTAAVHYTEAQTLTDAQKAQARTNVGAASAAVVADIENLSGHTVISGSYSGTTSVQINTSLAPGKYVLDISSITSADTDKSVSALAFQYPTGHGAQTLLLNRGTAIHKEITLDYTVEKVYLYASDNYSRSSGDAFSFSGLSLSLLYPLKQEIDILHGETIPIMEGALSTACHGLTIKAAAGVVELNGTTGATIYIKLSAKLGVYLNGLDLAACDSRLSLIPGHQYRIVMKLVSGSATVSSNSWFTAFKPGSSSTDTNHVVRTRNGSTEFTLDITADSSYNETNCVLYLSSSESFTNAVYVVSLYDLTAVETGIRYQTAINGTRYLPALPFQNIEQVRTTAYGLTLDFAPGIVTINGTTNNQLYVKLSAEFDAVQNGNVAASWASCLSLMPGHKYKAVMQLISGSATISDSSRFTAYKQGANTTDYTHVTLTRSGSSTFIAEITADDSYSNINLLMYLVSGEAFTNAVYTISVYDMTEMDYPFLINQSGGMMVADGVDSSAAIWSQWDGRLAFGMNTSTARLPAIIDGQLYANGTIIAHNTESQRTNRWGFHVYEAYSSDNYSRMTMLLDKHKSEFDGKPSLEMYYYTGASHYASAYGYTKIGSDVKWHSFLFDRDKMIAAGEIDCRFPITLARINPATDLDDTYTTVAAADAAYEPESFAEENLRCLRYIALLNADDGAMFYDVARERVVCKIGGKWCDLSFTDASSNYDF